jgi:hypothetical protein
LRAKQTGLDPLNIGSLTIVDALTLLYYRSPASQLIGWFQLDWRVSPLPWSVRMSKFKPDPPLQGDPLDLKKLKLEIIELNKKTRWQLMPAVTALISVLGLIVGVLIFGLQQASEQEKNRVAQALERRTALQNRVSSATDEILRFTGDPKVTVSRVSFLLADIQTNLDSPINRTDLDPPECKTLADCLPEYKKSLTLSLILMVKNDCDFTKHSRDVGFANAVVYYFDDYSTRLSKESENFDALDYILWQYIKALESLNNRYPGYLKSFYMKDDRLERNGKHGKRVKNDDSVYSHFMDITGGFTKHLEILCRENLGAKAREVRKSRLEEFRTALSNPALVKFLLESEINDTKCDP